MSSAVASASSSRASDEATSSIHNVHFALSPRIGVLSSPDVQIVLEANHLTDFSDLLKPFEDSIEQLTVRTSQLETRRCETFPLSFDNLDVFAPQSTSASTSTLFTPADLLSGEVEASDANPPSKKRKSKYSRPELLLDELSARVSAKSKAVWENRSKPSARRHSRRVSSIGGNTDSLRVFLTAEDEHDLERYKTAPIESLTPWFAETKSMVLNTRNVSEHETFGHPLAILLVVSANSSDPMNAFASLFEASQTHACPAFTQRPFVDPQILRYYVLLHDISSNGPDLTESLALLENVKKTYGLHCCLLPVNSAGVVVQDEAASSRISRLYYKALREERDSMQTSDDDPPKVPTKDGASEGASGIERKLSVNEVEKNRWYAAKQETTQYGALLTEEDVKKIRSFVRDFAAQSLIPFLERCVSLWNEQLSASRRGLTGRLFGAASRKFFSGGSVRGTSQGQSSASFASLGYYPHASMEAQTRKLADFAFMTRDYKLAAAMYDLGRRDYANDKAVKYIAGANEMFGLSHLMIMLCGHSAPIDVDSYLASAGQHYLASPRQKGSALQVDSLRATLLYYEVYRGLNFYRSAPAALVRTATEGSGDAENDLEVAGAMLLEQAAIADLRQADRPALRKCALHLVMAAHRYRSCGQKHLSLRCFQGAASFYEMMRRNRHGPDLKDETDAEGEEGRERLAEYIATYEAAKDSEWNLIEDHLGQELGQQASSDGQASQAVLHLFSLLHRQKQSAFSPLDESSQKHEACIGEFLNCCKYLDTDLKSLLEMHGQEASLPLVDSTRVMIQINSIPRYIDDQWLLLEQEARSGTDGLPFKGQEVKNTATVGEPFWIVLALVNPFNATLRVNNLTVELQNDNGEEMQSDLASVDVIDEIQFDPLEEKSVSIAISVNQPCKFKCASVHYLLENQVAFQESLVEKGKRLNETKEQRMSLQPIYAPIDTFTIVVENAKPHLEARLKSTITRLGLGEEVEAEIILDNKGKVPLRNARVVVNRPDCLLDRESGMAIPSDGETKLENNLKASKAMSLPIPSNGLPGGDSVEWPVLLRGSALGFLSLRLLFVYESEEGEVLTSQLQYEIQVKAVIDLAVQAGPSHDEDFQYHLKIDSVNLSDPEEEESINIHALSFVSPAWKTVMTVENSNDVLQSFTEMTHMERRTTSTLLQIDPSSSAMKDFEYTVRQLQSLLTGRSLDKATSPPDTTVNTSHIGDTASISPFLFLARKEYRLSILRQEFPSIQSTKELQRIFTLYEPNEVDLIAHWQMPKSKRRGQAFVFGMNLGPMHDYFEALFVKNEDKYTRSLYAEAEKEKAALWVDVSRNRLHVEEDSILFDFLTPSTLQSISHNFTSTSSKEANRCIISVEFLIRNLSTVRSRDVVLQLDNTLSQTHHTPQVNSSAHASYINRLTFRETLSPQQSKRIQAKVSINKAGTITLSPVLVKSTTSAGSGGQERSFQRWEHCTTPIKITQSD